MPRRKAKSVSFHPEPYLHPEERFQLGDIKERGRYEHQASHYYHPHPPPHRGPSLTKLLPLLLLLSSVATVLILPTVLPAILTFQPTRPLTIPEQPTINVQNHLSQNSSKKVFLPPVLYYEHYLLDTDSRVLPMEKKCPLESSTIGFLVLLALMNKLFF